MMKCQQAWNTVHGGVQGEQTSQKMNCQDKDITLKYPCECFTRENKLIVSDTHRAEIKLSYGL